MNSITPDLLRSTVSVVLNILLLFSLSQPKYSKRVTDLFMLLFFLISVFVSVYCYLYRDLTTLANYSAPWFLIVYILLKPLFLDSLMQWVFNFVTVINIYAAIVVLSYYIALLLPFTSYMITLLRILFFAAIIVVFRKWLRPLYRQAVASWNVFILLVVGIFVNIMYYFIFSKDIEVSLVEQFVPLLLLILLGISAYVCIFYSLKTASNEAALREENIKIQAREELLQKELSSYEDSINISRQHRHDLRHHNALLRELLTKEDTCAALEYLNGYDDSIVETALQQYCSNSVANAVFRLYHRRTKAAGIDYTVHANIPEDLLLTASDLGGLLSNLLENAWTACLACKESRRFIVISADMTENQLLLEVKNSVSGSVKFRNGLPVSPKEDGGIGTKSILRIIQRCEGMYRFKQEGDTFIVQMVLPLK